MQRELDMSKCKPYKDYKGLCKFRSFKEMKMFLPAIEKYGLEGKYLFRPVRQHEIDDVVEIYRVGYPDLYGNTNHHFIFWHDTLLEFLDSNKDQLLIVAEKLDEKKLVGAIRIKMDKGNMSIHWEHGVIHPEYRGKKLFREMCVYCDELSEKTGAEYGSIMAATFHIATQKVLKDLGWKVRGILPGSVICWNYEDKYYRHSLVYFDKFFNGGEELVPKRIDMIPEVELVSECLGSGF